MAPLRTALLVIAACAAVATADVTWSETMPSGHYGNCQKWATFLDQLRSQITNVRSFTVYSNRYGTWSCTTQSAAQSIASNMGNRVYGDVGCNGYTYSTRPGCVAGGSPCGSGTVAGLEFSTTTQSCSCATTPSNGFVLRPGIYNSNWGGVGTTCGASSQSFTITFSTGPPPVTISLLGANPMNTEAGRAFSDPGVSVGGTSSYTVEYGGTLNVGNPVYGSGQTRQYRARASDGRYSSWITRTVNVIDTTKPTLTLSYTSRSFDIQAFAYPGTSCVDPLRGMTLTAKLIADNVKPAIGTYTVTYRCTDTAGNYVDKSATVIITGDNVKPTITLKGANPLTIEAGGQWCDSTKLVVCPKPFVDPGFTASDDRDGDLTAFVVDSPDVDVYRLGTQVITYTVKDRAGNTATVSRTVNVQDTQAPVIHLKGASSVTLELGQAYTELGAYALDLRQTSGLTVSISGTVDVNTVGSYTITYTCSDSQSRAAQAVTRTVVVSDTQFPTITVNGESKIVLEATAGASYTEGTSAVSATDAGKPIPVSTSGLPIDISKVGHYTVEYSATDSAGHVARASRTVVVADTTAPTIVLKGADEMTLEAVTDTYTEQGVTLDDKGITSAAALESALVIRGQVLNRVPGDYVLTYDVTDAVGNKAVQKKRIVHIQDTTAPAITLVGESTITLEAGTKFDDPGVTVRDLVDGAIPDENVQVTGAVDIMKPGTYTVTYSVADAARNRATLTRSVVVRDTTPPTITLNGQQTIVLEKGFEDYTEYGAQCSDIVSGSFAAANDARLVANPDFVNSDVEQTYTLTYTCTDGAGLTTTTTRSVQVLDTTKPFLQLKGEATVVVEGGDTYTDAGVTVLDGVLGGEDSTATVNVQGIPTDTTVLGKYTITYTAVDTSGLQADKITRTVIIQDTTPPTVTLKGDAEVTIEAGSDFDAADPGVTLSDVITDEAYLAEHLKRTSSVDKMRPGKYLVSYSASDEEGNVAPVVHRAVIVKDTTAPTITVLGDNPLVLEAGSAFSQPGASSADLIDGDLSSGIVVELSESPVDMLSVHTVTVTYRSTDDSDNEATATRTVNIVDTTAPTVSLGGPEELAMTVCPFPDQLTVCDELSGVYEIVPPSKTSDRVCAQADTAPYSRIKFCDGDRRTYWDGRQCSPWNACQATNNVWIPPAATASDIVDGELVPQQSGTVDFRKPGVYTVTFTATDAEGNAASKQQTVTVRCRDGYYDNAGSCDLCSLGYKCVGGSRDICLGAIDNEHAGFYQDEYGKTTCKACPPNSAVESNGATSIESCSCGAGFEIDSATSTCVDVEPPVIDNCPTEELLVKLEPGTEGNTFALIAKAANIDVTDNCLAFTKDGATSETLLDYLDDQAGCISITFQDTQTKKTVTGATPIQLGRLSVEMFVTDGLNEAETTCTIVAEVVDEVAPELEGCPSNKVLTMDEGKAYATMDLEIHARDNHFLIVDTNLPKGVCTLAAGSRTLECSCDAESPCDAVDGCHLKAGVHEYSISVQDEAGNEPQRCDFTITVNDNQPPEAVCPPDVAVHAAAGSSSAAVSWPAPQHWDNAGIDAVFSTHASGDVFGIGRTVVTQRVVDKSGQESSCWFSVHVCPAGKWGEACDKQCACNSKEKCHPLTGECTWTFDLPEQETCSPEKHEDIIKMDVSVVGLQQNAFDFASQRQAAQDAIVDAFPVARIVTVEFGSVSRANPATLFGGLLADVVIKLSSESEVHVEQALTESGATVWATNQLMAAVSSLWEVPLSLPETPDAKLNEVTGEYEATARLSLPLRTAAQIGTIQNRIAAVLPLSLDMGSNITMTVSFGGIERRNNLEQAFKAAMHVCIIMPASSTAEEVEEVSTFLEETCTTPMGWQLSSVISNGIDQRVYLAPGAQSQLTPRNSAASSSSSTASSSNLLLLVLAAVVIILLIVAILFFVKYKQASNTVAAYASGASSRNPSFSAFGEDRANATIVNPMYGDHGDAVPVWDAEESAYDDVAFFNGAAAETGGAGGYLDVSPHEEVGAAAAEDSGAYLDVSPDAAMPAYDTATAGQAIGAEKLYDNPEFMTRDD